MLERCTTRSDARTADAPASKAADLPDAPPSSGSTSGGTSGSGSGSGPGGAAGGTDPRFDYCTSAIEAGYGPYTRGSDPEYRWYRDGDSDGTVCET